MMCKKLMFGLVCAAAATSFGEGEVMVTSAKCGPDGAHFTVEVAAETPSSPDAVRSLYACYGMTDRGDKLLMWDHVENLGDIGFDASSGEYVLSASSFNKSAPFVRFVASTVSGFSTDYCTRGIFAQWDGIDNTIVDGKRCHSDKTTQWADLSGNGWDAENPNDRNWSDKAFLCNRSQDCAYQAAKKNGRSLLQAIGDVWTFEAFVKPQFGNEANYAGICGGHNGGLVFGQYVNGSYCFCLAGVSGWSDHSYSTSLLALDKCHHVAYVAAADASEGVHHMSLYIDGTLVDEYDTTAVTEMSFGEFWIGRAFADPTGRNFQGDIYAVRAYDTALTTSEILANRAVDVARFDTSSSSHVSGLFNYLALRTVDMKVNVEGGAVASFDLTAYGLAADDPAYDLYSVCDVADRGNLTNGWAAVALVRSGVTAETGPMEGVAVPDGFGDRYTCVRFILVNPNAPTSRSYAPGLEAQWDGVDNAGYGQHSTTAQTWADLTGKWDLTTPVAVESLQWTETGYRFAQVGNTAFRTTGLLPSLDGTWTVEAYFKPTPNNVGNYHGVGAGHYGSAGGLILVQFVNDHYEIGCQNWSDHSKFGFPVSLLAADQCHHVAVTADADALRGAIYIDGIAQDTFSFDPGDSLVDCDTFMLGCAFTSLDWMRTFDGVIHTMRVYKRSLTEEEVLKNGQIDAIRFGDGSRTATDVIASDVYRQSLVVNLTVATDGDWYGELDPPVGSYCDIIARLPLDCTAAQFHVTNSTLMECVGSTLSAVGMEPVEGNQLTVTLEKPSCNTDWLLTWHWAPVGYAIETNVYGVGHVELSPTDYHGFYSVGSTATLTAVDDTDQGTFDHWEGDVAATDVRKREITLTMDAVKRVQAVFLPNYWTLNRSTKLLTDGINTVHVELGSDDHANELTIVAGVLVGETLDLSLPMRDEDGNEYSVVKIGGNAFNTAEGFNIYGHRERLKKVIYPDTLRSICQQAFAGCGSLELVLPALVPDFVTEFDADDFYGPYYYCTSLTQEFSIGFSPIKTAGHTWISQTSITKASFGPYVKVVPEYCYQYTPMQELFFAEGVETIAYGSSCSDLVRVTPTFPESVRNFGWGSDASPNLLIDYLYLPNVTNFDQRAYIDKVQVRKVWLGPDATRIPENFLWHEIGMTNVTFCATNEMVIAGGAANPRALDDMDEVTEFTFMGPAQSKKNLDIIFEGITSFLPVAYVSRKQGGWQDLEGLVTDRAEIEGLLSAAGKNPADYATIYANRKFIGLYPVPCPTTNPTTTKYVWLVHRNSIYDKTSGMKLILR